MIFSEVLHAVGLALMIYGMYGEINWRLTAMGLAWQCLGLLLQAHLLKKRLAEATRLRGPS